MIIATISMIFAQMSIAQPSPSPSPPRKHYSIEEYDPAFYCFDYELPSQWWDRAISMATFGLWDPAQKIVDIAPIIWEWTPVEDSGGVVTLEGVVVPEGEQPHVSFEDSPISHYTHDFTFHVRPDQKPEFTNLLGFIVKESHDPCLEDRGELEGLKRELRDLGSMLADATPAEKGDIKREIDKWHHDNDRRVKELEQKLASPECRLVIDQSEQQTNIEVEWESGLGASNDGNICAAPNRRGESGGFFSAGHNRGDMIWNWPTVGDRVHVEGQWIWDRGHSPVTEIHPPRLVVIQRHLPNVFQVTHGDIVFPPSVTPPPPPTPPPPATVTTFSTRIDVFASGDGGGVLQ